MGDLNSIIWKPQPTPIKTTYHGSDPRRPWPAGFYKDGRRAAMLTCGTSYSPSVAWAGAHEPITVYVADYSEHPFDHKWSRVPQQAETLQEAIRFALIALDQNPSLFPPTLN